MIIRAHNRDRFVIIDKTSIEDDRLSWKARGMLTYLLSKPDNWQVYISQLVKAGPDGRTSVRATLLELEHAGYIVRSQAHRDDGQFDSPDVQVFEKPQVATGVGFSDSGDDLQECEKVQVGTEIGFTDIGSADIGKPDTSEEELNQVLTQAKTDSLFAAVVDVCHIDTAAITTSAREAIEEVVKQLHEVGATHDEVIVRARLITAGWRDGRLTPASLTRHWHEAQPRDEYAAEDVIYVENAWGRQRRTASCGECDNGWLSNEPDEDGTTSVRPCSCRTAVAS